MTKAEAARQQGDDDLAVVLKALERVILLSGKSFREIEGDLGFANSTFHRWLSGKSEVRLRQVLVLLAYLDLEPKTFFEFAYRTAQLDGQKMLDALVRSPLSSGATPAAEDELPNPDREYVLSVVEEVMMRRRAEAAHSDPAEGPGKKT